MKKLIFTILFCAMFAPLISAETLGDLKTRLRYRLDETDTNKAFFTDSALTHWLNMAQEAVVTAGNLLPRCTIIAFPNSYGMTLDSRVRRVTQVVVLTKVRWSVVPPGIPTDTLSMHYYVNWLTETQPQVIMTRAPTADTVLSVTYSSSNPAQYLTLATTALDVTNVLVHTGGQWWPMLYNQGFLIDTLANQFSVHRVGGAVVTETHVYYRTPLLSTNDTIRVFYRRLAVGPGDSLRVCYSRIPTTMTTNSTECDLPDDLEHFIVEEAMGYYFQALRMYNQASQIWQQVRIDMGLLKPGAEQ